MIVTVVDFWACAPVAAALMPHDGPRGRAGLRVAAVLERTVEIERLALQFGGEAAAFERADTLGGALHGADAQQHEV